MPLSPGVSTLIEHQVTNPNIDPIYVNDAIVTVTIIDSAGDELSGENWPIILPYIASSNGLYSKSFSPFQSLINNELYTVIIEVIGSDGLENTCEKKIRATNRKC